MKKEKEIPLKNYILLSIVLILTIVVVIQKREERLLRVCAIMRLSL